VGEEHSRNLGKQSTLMHKVASPQPNYWDGRKDGEMVGLFLWGKIMLDKHLPEFCVGGVLKHYSGYKKDEGGRTRKSSSIQRWGGTRTGGVQAPSKSVKR